MSILSRHRPWQTGVDDKALGQQDPWQTGVDVLGAIMIPFAKMRVGVLFEGEENSWQK